MRHEPTIPLFLWVATAALAHILWGGGAEEVVGVDRSSATIAFAREHGRPERGVELLNTDELVRAPPRAFDLCYSNGVFHHIQPGERAAALRTIRDALAPGGHLFLWENHPGNPGTRYIMARCAFDDDAVPLWPHQTRRLLREGGFDVVKTGYRFLFPRPLAFLRPLERRLLTLPIGAQYVVVGRRASG